MSFFNSAEPVLRRKQSHLDVQDLRGLLKIRWCWGRQTLIAVAYTRIDQIFVLWGWMTALMFWTPQFLPVSWTHQAIVWTLLTLLGLAATAGLAWFWVRVEQLRWLIYGWAVLMLGGLGLTDYGIFVGSGPILLNLCPLWLGICAVGYGVTGIGVRSRTFLLMALCHLLTIPVIKAVPTWQFLVTGGVMAACLLGLAELQWDMRPPLASQVLSLEERAFNYQQHLRRSGKLTPNA